MNAEEKKQYLKQIMTGCEREHGAIEKIVPILLDINPWQARNVLEWLGAWIEEEIERENNVSKMNMTIEATSKSAKKVMEDMNPDSDEPWRKSLKDDPKR